MRTGLVLAGPQSPRHFEVAFSRWLAVEAALVVAPFVASDNMGDYEGRPCIMPPGHRRGDPYLAFGRGRRRGAQDLAATAARTDFSLS
jgi:hypothetical protein